MTSQNNTRSVGTQTEKMFDSCFEMYFNENYETNCPIKYPEEVANRPLNYEAKCACNCNSGNKNCTESVNIYQIVFECRPKPKDFDKGIVHSFDKCLIDLCDHHYNRIKKENGGKLPTFVGSDIWDAMDTISTY